MPGIKVDLNFLGSQVRWEDIADGELFWLQNRETYRVGLRKKLTANSFADNVFDSGLYIIDGTPDITVYRIFSFTNPYQPNPRPVFELNFNMYE